MAFPVVNNFNKISGTQVGGLYVAFPNKSI